MPNIKDYNPQVQVQQQTGLRAPGATAFGGASARAGVEVARGVQQLGQGIDRFIVKREMAKANKAASALQVKYTEAHREAEHGAGFDDDVVTPLLDAYDKDVQSLSEFNTFEGQQEFERLTSRYRAGLTQKAVASQAGRQGSGAAQDLQEEIDNLGQSVFSDPTLFWETADDLQQQLADPDGRFSALSEVQRQKLQTDVRQELAGQAAQGIMALDPQLAVEMSVAGEGVFGELSAQKRAAYTQKAMANYRTQLQFLQGQEDRERRDLEREQTTLQQNTSKLMDTKFANDDLTTAEVFANRENLTPAAYRFNIERLTTKRSAQTVPEIYSDLLNRALAGEDVTSEAENAYHNWNLELGSFNKIIDTFNAKWGGGANIPDKFQQAEEYVDRALKPNDFNPAPGSQFRHAEAKAELWQWFRENPGAGPRSATEEAQRLVKDYSIVDQNSFPINTPTPRFMAGQRGVIDYTETLKATDDAFKRGDLSPRAYERQLDLIDKWQAFDERKANLEAQ
jgi:hypothetical protein